MRWGGPAYTPPDAECAVCETPSDEWDIQDLSRDGIHMLNEQRARVGNDPLCSKDCLERLRDSAAVASPARDTDDEPRGDA